MSNGKSMEVEKKDLKGKGRNVNTGWEWVRVRERERERERERKKTEGWKDKGSKESKRERIRKVGYLRVAKVKSVYVAVPKQIILAAITESNWELNRGKRP
jgi:hypothetical protein